jgi:hypothetical protein
LERKRGRGEKELRVSFWMDFSVNIGSDASAYHYGNHLRSFEKASRIIRSSRIEALEG